MKDAKFRSIQPFGTYAKNSPLSNIATKSVEGSWYIVGSVNIPWSQPMPDNITNEAIFLNWGSILINDRTARENCDVWMLYQGQTDTQGVVGNPAVEWCRSQKIWNTPCNIPNLYQAMCLWTCGDKIDELDPTTSSYSTLKIGYTAKGDPAYGRSQKQGDLISYAIWASTEYSYTDARAVRYNGVCANYGKNQKITTVPILELF